MSISSLFCITSSSLMTLIFPVSCLSFSTSFVAHQCNRQSKRASMPFRPIFSGRERPRHLRNQASILSSFLGSLADSRACLFSSC